MVSLEGFVSSCNREVHVSFYILFLCRSSSLDILSFSCLIFRHSFFCFTFFNIFSMLLFIVYFLLPTSFFSKIFHFCFIFFFVYLIHSLFDLFLDSFPEKQSFFVSNILCSLCSLSFLISPLFLHLHVWLFSSFPFYVFRV